MEVSTGRVKKVLLPPLLLETAIALLSFHRADASLTPELKVTPNYAVAAGAGIFCLRFYNSIKKCHLRQLGQSVGACGCVFLFLARGRAYAGRVSLLVPSVPFLLLGNM